MITVAQLNKILDLLMATGDWKKLHEEWPKEWPKEGHYHLKEITFPESPRFSVIDAMAKERTENQEG